MQTSRRTTSDLREQIPQIVASDPSPELQSILEPKDDWAVSIANAVLIDGLIDLTKPSSVLEFGSGRSSLVLASALDRKGGGRLTSIEHQPQYSRESWSRVSAFRGVDAHLVVAPLGVRMSKHGLLRQYIGIDEHLRDRGPFDMVFVDAPPGVLGRDATLFQTAPFLSDQALVVLDDAARVRERTALNRWRRALPLEEIYYRETGPGVSVCRLTRKTRSSFSLRTFAGTLHDRLLELQYHSSRKQ